MSAFLIPIVFCICVGITFMGLMRSTLQVLGVNTCNNFFEAERIEFWGYIQFLAYGVLELYPRAVMHARCAKSVKIVEGVLASLAAFVAIMWSFLLGLSIVYIIGL